MKLTATQLSTSQFTSISDSSEYHTRWNLEVDTVNEYTYLVHNYNNSWVLERKNDDGSIDTTKIDSDTIIEIIV